ncbi:ethanolamine utilization protein [Deltaproteobacteria bacterium Smac51]|nr:ethanolamine utilization protein [Deltaproteobacteria bacterium Smac51]
MPDTAPAKPLMVIGPVGAGKSTLLHALNLGSGEVKKTEALTYLDQAIDTPGEMLTMPRFYNALILNSVRSRLVLFLMDGSRPIRLPARLALALKAPVVGVVTKIDVAQTEARQKAAAALECAGVKEIFEISSLTGEGIEELNAWISGVGKAN